MTRHGSERRPPEDASGVASSWQGDGEAWQTEVREPALITDSSPRAAMLAGAECW